MEVPKSPIRKIRQRGQANFGRVHKQNVILNNPSYRYIKQIKLFLFAI